VNHINVEEVMGTFHSTLLQHWIFFLY
jgi:hypothetical protein